MGDRREIQVYGMCLVVGEKKSMAAGLFSRRDETGGGPEMSKTKETFCANRLSGEAKVHECES